MIYQHVQTPVPIIPLRSTTKVIAERSFDSEKAAIELCLEQQKEAVEDCKFLRTFMFTSGQQKLYMLAA